jgi:hydroxyethylthiazole kinase-like uncharacterized protein yjeF
MKALYSTAQIRAVEQAAAGPLMERAGDAAAQAAVGLLKNAAPASPILVLAGPGNNGGDAFEVAAHLADAGWQTTVLRVGDPLRYSPEAQRALQRLQQGRSKILAADMLPSLPEQDWALVIDGLFGIGLARPIEGALRALVERVNALPCPRLALDVPSGLNADTGAIVGANGIAVRATHTITFIGDKIGLHTAFGQDYAGTVSVATLEIDNALYPAATSVRNEPALFTGVLQPRLHNTHKGSYGDATILGGAHGMGGAVILAARAAAKCGAGRVFVGFIDDVPLYDSAQPELMCRAAGDLDFAGATLVAGPGMGGSDKAQSLLQRVLENAAPLVLDADALNLIAARPDLQKSLAHRTHSALMTPHPLEAARLLGCDSGAIQADRPAAARRLAQQFNAVVVLKGSGSVIARPDGFCVINNSGNAGLATAGSGDVLSGICGALLAQGWPVWEAALGAVWMHGHAADLLLARGIGPIGLTASELIPVVREILNGLATK